MTERHNQAAVVTLLGEPGSALEASSQDEVLLKLFSSLYSTFWRESSRMSVVTGGVSPIPIEVLSYPSEAMRQGHIFHEKRKHARHMIPLLRRVGFPVTPEVPDNVPELSRYVVNTDFPVFPVGSLRVGEDADDTALHVAKAFAVAGYKLEVVFISWFPQVFPRFVMNLLNTSTLSWGNLRLYKNLRDQENDPEKSVLDVLSLETIVALEFIANFIPVSAVFAAANALNSPQDETKELDNIFRISNK